MSAIGTKRTKQPTFVRFWTIADKASATPKNAPVGGGYMTITNTGNVPDRLIGGASDASNRFGIHEMRMDNGVIKMRPLTDGPRNQAGTDDRA